MKKVFLTVAALLFMMETESIANDARDSFAVRDWFEKYGDDADKYADKFLSTEDAIKDLATAIEKDYKEGHWQLDDQGQLYSPEMFSWYGGILDKHLEQQLANFTKVGTQMTLSL